MTRLSCDGSKIRIPDTAGTPDGCDEEMCGWIGATRTNPDHPDEVC